MKIKVYGSRGTMPLFDRDNLKFGGNTSCFGLETCGRTILLDAGTGIAQFAKEQRGKNPLSCDILLSHLHLDHIVGFLGFPQLFGPNNVRVFTKSRCDNGTALNRQVLGAFKPPYWPIILADMLRVEFVEIADDVPFSPGDGIAVTPFTAQHPDDASAFRIEAEGKSVVYLMDYEIDENIRYKELIGFCKGADLVILDACYMPDDYPARRGWGHSTYEMGVKLAEKSGCARLMLSHFAQEYSDTVLDGLTAKLEPQNILVSYDGMELEL